MVQNPKITCSPYLLMKRRNLCDACRQIAERHGRPAVPCGACNLADLCPISRDRAGRSDDVRALPRRYDPVEIFVTGT